MHLPGLQRSELKEHRADYSRLYGGIKESVKLRVKTICGYNWFRKVVAETTLYVSSSEYITESSVGDRKGLAVEQGEQRSQVLAVELRCEHRGDSHVYKERTRRL